jgi:hypothetical protein
MWAVFAILRIMSLSRPVGKIVGISDQVAEPVRGG